MSTEGWWKLTRLLCYIVYIIKYSSNSAIYYCPPFFHARDLNCWFWLVALRNFYLEHWITLDCIIEFYFYLANLLLPSYFETDPFHDRDRRRGKNCSSQRGNTERHGCQGSRFAVKRAWVWNCLIILKLPKWQIWLAYII